MRKLILPCPFCGNDPITDKVQGGNYIVDCTSAKCTGLPMAIGKELDIAIDRWNTRPGTEAISQEAYTLAWLREEAKEAGWNLLDLVEAARDKRLVKKVAKARNPFRYHPDECDDL